MRQDMRRDKTQD